LEGTVRIPLFLILILAQIALFPLGARASEAENSAWDKGWAKPVVSSGKPGAVGREVIAEKVKRIYLYCVTDGKVRKEVLGKDVFKAEEGVRVNGHVCGILVFCTEDLRANLDGRPLSEIRNNGKGSFSLRNFGKLTPEEIASSDSDRAYYETLLSGTESGDEGPVMVPGAII
jgi:hypothetical protein